MFSTQRCTWPDFGSTNIRLFDTELATIRDALSGVTIRWCGSLPVGTVPTTWRVVSSIRLSVASPELSTITLLAWAAEENRPAAATSAALAVNAAERPGKRNLRMKAHFGEQRAL